MKRMIALLLTLAVSTTVFAGTITLKGSDTMVRLGQRWAEEYMKAHKDVTVQVSGGGSGTGIAALLNGGTDICQASRDMKPQEYADAETRKIALHKVAMALDGIAVFVSDANPVKELSMQQLRGIYTGSITNWKELGGPAHVIVLYGRENNSGTYGYFKEHVLKGEDFAEATQTLPGTASVVSAVVNDKFGIGYGGVAWDKGVRALLIKKDEKTAGVEPSLANITNGTYPISRELYWFYSGVPSSEMKQFLNWALSDEGQKIAQLVDYVPLPKEKAQASIIE
jgi:phosphate transport system substrate-binding protein